MSITHLQINKRIEIGLCIRLYLTSKITVNIYYVTIFRLFNTFESISAKNKELQQYTYQY